MQITEIRPGPPALRIWRLSSILSTAVTMSAALAHLMEMPAKMRYERDLYVRLHRTLYNMFGKFAGPTEAFAVVSTGLLALWTRKHQPESAGLTAAAALSLAAADGVFWAAVEPVNRTMGSWPMDAIPADWSRWRDRWEYGHAVRACLATGALATLTLSMLKERTQS